MEWYYASEGQRRGPVSGDELTKLIVAGLVRRESLVWNAAMPDWAPAGQVSGLQFPASAGMESGTLAPNPYTQSQTSAQGFDGSIEPAPNPYAQSPAPAASVVPGYSAHYGAAPAVALPYAGQSEEGISHGTLQILRQTAPWARMHAILLLLYGVLCGFGACAGLAFGSGAFGGSQVGMRALGPGGAFIFFVYGAAAVLCIIPAVFLSQYASAINRLNSNSRSYHLDAALSCQKSYFLFVGIMSLIALCLIGLGLLFFLFALMTHM